MGRTSVSILLTRTLETLLLPPGGPLLLAAAGVALSWRGWLRARWLAAAGLALLYLCGTPLVGAPLLRATERYPAQTAAQVRASGAEAIVVLGAGRTSGPEYGGPVPSAYSLQRLRYATYLHRLTGVPILVSGGAPLDEKVAEATLMAATLRQAFGIEQVWMERGSRNTEENALYSARLLRARHIHRILLVTHAWHMARAVAAFQGTGLEIVAAPTGFARRDVALPLRLLPSADALLHCRLALHESLGALWYRLRY